MAEFQSSSSASTTRKKVVKVFVGSLNAAKINCVKDAVTKWMNPHLNSLSPREQPQQQQLEGTNSHCDYNYEIQAEGMAAESGVSEQPMGLEETMVGAVNRAHYLEKEQKKKRLGLQPDLDSKADEDAASSPSLILLVGLESGVLLTSLASSSLFLQSGNSSGRTDGNEERSSSVVEDKCYDFCGAAIIPIYLNDDCSVEEKEGGGATKEGVVATGFSGGFALPQRVASHFHNNEGSPTLKQYNPSFEAGGFIPDPTGPGVLSQLSEGRMTRGSQMQQAVEMALLSITNPKAA